MHGKCGRRAVQPASPSPPPPSSRQCKAPEKYEPSEEIRGSSQVDGRHWKSRGIARRPRRRSSADHNISAALAEQAKDRPACPGAGAADRPDRAWRSWANQPRNSKLLVTLVTQLFEAEDQAKTAEKKGAQATAAVLASVRVYRDETTELEATTRATIDALVGEGLNARRTIARPREALGRHDPCRSRLPSTRKKRGLCT